MNDAGVVTGVAVAVQGERITAVGPQSELERGYPSATRVDCKNRLLTPGFVDSHTHAIFGKPRFEEQELRASGLDYMEIARRGGGIHSSVRDLRARAEDELLDLAIPRLRRLAAHGVTTVEVKSGYGLSVEDYRQYVQHFRAGTATSYQDHDENFMREVAAALKTLPPNVVDIAVM